MKNPEKSIQLRIMKLLESGSRVLQLRMCYHDYLMLTGLPKNWREKVSEPCLWGKSKRFRTCTAFCGAGGYIDRQINRQPDGLISECPYGLIDLSAPVFCSGMLAGVLSAGGCREESDTEPLPGLSAPAYSREWLEDRLAIVSSLAKQVECILRSQSNYSPNDRRSLVLQYIDENMELSADLPGLAKNINLSESRVSHLVKELFHKSFSDVLNEARAVRAARYLSLTDIPVGDIALRLGFCDQSHMTRIFRKHFELPPLAYRKQNRAKP